MASMFRRALVVAIVLIASTASLQIVARSDEPDSKPSPPVLDERQAPRAGSDELIPAAGHPPAGTRCDGSWFENAALRYGVCLPDGWGFTDFTSAAPLALIPRRHLPSLRVLSPSAFPWRPGDAPFDVTRARGIVDVEITVLEPDIDPGCTSPVPLRVELLGCEQALDDLGLPAPRGELTEFKIPVRPPGLLVIARTSPRSLAREVDELWRLIASIVAR